eukprot:355002-Chlamydomonas_euryale.AAC.4
MIGRFGIGACVTVANTPLVSVHTYQMWSAEQGPAHHVLWRARSGTKSQFVTIGACVTVANGYGM